MAISIQRPIRDLVGASCALALLAGTVGVASAEAVPQATKATAESSSAASRKPCTGYHYDENHMHVWDPAGCTPP